MITFEKLGAVYSSMSFGVSTVYSGISVVNTAYSSIMPAWAGRLGQLKLY